MKNYIFSFIFLLQCFLLTSQDVIDVNGTFSGNIDHTAPEGVNLIPKYTFESTTNDKMDAYLDPASGVPTFQDFDENGVLNITEFITPSEDYQVGSIKGNANVNGGAATYTIPLQFPLGLNGMTPELTLYYNSESKSIGNFGKGWGISGISEINRIVYDQDHEYVRKANVDLVGDQYSFDGQKLIVDWSQLPSPPPNNIPEYPYITASQPFDRITSKGGNNNGAGPDWFDVNYKEGLSMELGRTPDSRQTGSNDDQTALRWKVNKIYDPNGNCINYSYINEDNGNRIDKIRYGGNCDQQVEPIIEIEFIYEDQDPIEKYIYGRNDDVTKIVKEIRIIQQGEVYGSYGFSYSNESAHLLREIHFYGSDGLGVNPTKMYYNNNEIEMELCVDCNFYDQNAIIQLQHVDLRKGDFNGDGKSDFIGYHYSPEFVPTVPVLSSLLNTADQLIGKSYTHYNLYFADENGYHKSVNYNLPANFMLFDPTFANSGAFSGLGSSILDLNGDGLEDVIFVVQDSYTKFIEYLSDGTELISQVTPTIQLANNVTANMTTSVADFDGNGTSDMFIFLPEGTTSNPTWKVVFFDLGLSDASGIFPEALIPSAPYTFIPVDMEGDGKSELLTWEYDAQNPHKCVILEFDVYCINFGQGTPNQPHIEFSQKHDLLVDINRNLKPAFGDINGDGNADLMFRNSDTRFIRHGTGKGFGQPENILETNNENYLLNPHVNRDYFIDINGDGLTDLVNISNNYQRLMQNFMRYNMNWETYAYNYQNPNPWNQLLEDFPDSHPVYRDFIEQTVGYPYDCTIDISEFSYGINALVENFSGLVDFPNEGTIPYVFDPLSCDDLPIYLVNYGWVDFENTVNNYNQLNFTNATGLLEQPQRFMGGLWRQLFLYAFRNQSALDNTTVIRKYINNGNGFDEYESNYTAEPLRMSSKTYFDFIDMDGDGSLEIIAKNDPLVEDNIVPVHIFNLGEDSENDLLSHVSDGLGNLTSFDYEPMSNSTVYTKGVGAQFPVKDIQTSRKLVRSMTQHGPNGNDRVINYKYEGGLYHNRGLGFVGFRKTISRDLSTNIEVENINFFSDNYYSLLSIEQRTKSVQDDILVSFTKTDFTSESLPLFHYLRDSECWNNYTDFKTKVTETVTENYLTNSSSITTNFVYDDFNNVLTSTSKIGPIGFTDNHMETIDVVNVYGSHGNWGAHNKLTSVTTTMSREPVAGQAAVLDDYVRSSSSTYDINGNLLTTLDDKGVLTENVNINTFGNPELLRTTIPGFDPVETSFTYDPSNRYVATETNPFDETITYEYNSPWAEPTKVTDHLGHSENYYFDGLGRLETFVDIYGTVTNYKTDWVNVLPQDPSADILETPDVMYSISIEGDAQPTSTTLYNRLGMERLGSSENHFGELTSAIIKYNDLGLVEKSTEPFKDGQETILVGVNEYDDPIQRMTSTLTENQTGTELIPATTYNYQILNGLFETTITSPEPNNQTSSKIKRFDASGQLVQVETSYEADKLYYRYLSNGNVEKTLLDTKVLSEMEYDNFGRQTKLIEPNYGTTEYSYDGLDRLIYQKDFKGNEFSTTYDQFGRTDFTFFWKVQGGTNQSLEPTGNYEYDYYSNAPGDNLLKRITAPNGNYTEYTYDDYNRIVKTIENVTGELFVHEFDYDNYGRILSEEYPGNFKTVNSYNSRGYLDQITNSGQDIILWKALEEDHLGRYTRYSKGNGLIAETNFDAYGFPIVMSTPNHEIQNLSSSFNKISGNMNFRKDNNYSVKEDFLYDQGFDRLVDYRVTQLEVLSGPFSTPEILYDPLEVCYNSSSCNGDDQAGNVMFKTDAGSFSYGDPIKSNAVTEVSNDFGLIQEDQNVIYNGFNSIEHINQGGNKEMNFFYGADQQRRKSELLLDGSLHRTRYYLGDFEKQIIGSETIEVNYVNTPSGVTAMYVKENGNGNYYFPFGDHLGSLLQVTDVEGNIVAAQNFDPYGRHRNPVSWTYMDDSPISDGTIPSWLWRGYTGHEHMDEFGLINMNGRLYDPVTARMLSPDNFVQDEESPQSYNRYSYVSNNPLKYIDPSGERQTYTKSKAEIEAKSDRNISRDNEDWYENADGSAITWYDSTEDEILDENGSTLKNVGSNLQEVEEHLGISNGFSFDFRTHKFVRLSNPRKNSISALVTKTDVSISAHLIMNNLGSNFEKISGKTQISNVIFNAEIYTSHISLFELQEGGFTFGIGNSFTAKGEHPTHTSFSKIDDRISVESSAGAFSGSSSFAQIGLSLLELNRVSNQNRRKNSLNFSVQGGVNYVIKDVMHPGIRTVAINGEKRFKLVKN